MDKVGCVTFSQRVGKVNGEFSQGFASTEGSEVVDFGAEAQLDRLKCSFESWEIVKLVDKKREFH